MPRERADDGSRIRVPDIHMGNLCCVLGSWLWPGPVLIDGSFAKWTNGCKISVCLSIKLNCIKLKCKIFLFFYSFPACCCIGNCNEHASFYLLHSIHVHPLFSIPFWVFCDIMITLPHWRLLELLTHHHRLLMSWRMWCPYTRRS